jgi:alkylation response protein AidB-like acyl-CoA dehydrogenase
VTTIDVEGFREHCLEFFASRYEVLDPHKHDPPALVLHTTGDDHDRPLREAQQHQRGLWEAGLAGLRIPARYGGCDLPDDLVAVFDEIASGFATPSDIPLSVGLSLAVPTLLHFGTEEQCAALIPRTLSSESVWCQLFSEPDAGSDLASLRTSATQVDDGWVVSGQKVWTSFAQHASFGLLLARTGGPGSGHGGITLFVLPMDAPGVTVRPLREMTGGTHFNEVHLDDVRLGPAQLLGELGKGWAAATFTLGNERALTFQRRRPRWQRVAESVPDVEWDPVAQDRINRLAALESVHGMNRQRGASFPANIAKLMGAQIEQSASELGVDLLGMSAIAHDGDESHGGRAAHWFLGARANSLAGGTDEIQRNVIAERVLGLPREARPPTHER